MIVTKMLIDKKTGMLIEKEIQELTAEEYIKIKNYEISSFKIKTYNELENLIAMVQQN